MYKVAHVDLSGLYSRDAHHTEAEVRLYEVPLDLIEPLEDIESGTEVLLRDLSLKIEVMARVVEVYEDRKLARCIFNQPEVRSSRHEDAEDVRLVYVHPESSRMRYAWAVTAIALNVLFVALALIYGKSIFSHIAGETTNRDDAIASLLSPLKLDQISQPSVMYSLFLLLLIFMPFLSAQMAYQHLRIGGNPYVGAVATITTSVLGGIAFLLVSLWIVLKSELSMAWIGYLGRDYTALAIGALGCILVYQGIHSGYKKWKRQYRRFL
jgi:hypothetical protein